MVLTVEKRALLKAAQEYCEAQGLRLTPPRVLVLDIVARSKKPLGAYDILDALSKNIEDPKPPTAYRAIEFWQAHGFIHRIESLNAYVVCDSDHRHGGTQFLVCDSCGGVQEAHICHIPEDLSQKTRAAGFEVQRWNAELHGLCRSCR